MEPDRDLCRAPVLRVLGLASLVIAALLLSSLGAVLALPVWFVVGWNARSLVRERSARWRAREQVWEVGAWSTDPVSTMAAWERVAALPEGERRRLLSMLEAGRCPAMLPASAVEAYRRSLGAPRPTG